MEQRFKQLIESEYHYYGLTAYHSLKKIFVYILFALLPLQLHAQCDQEGFDRLILQGSQASKTGDYQTAVNKFSAAMIACPSQSKIAQQKIVEIFNAINQLKIKAEKAEKNANSERLKAEISRKNTIELLYILKPANIANMCEYFKEKANQELINGNYKNALDNLKLAKFSPEITDSAEIIRQINNSLNCLEYLKAADALFDLKNLEKADSIYKKILVLNGADKNVQAKRQKINEMINELANIKIKPFKTIDWKKIKYAKCVEKEIDLTDPANQCLYYPTEPKEGFMSLIDYLIKLVAEGKIIVFKPEYQNICTDFNPFKDWYATSFSTNTLTIENVKEKLGESIDTVMVQDISSGNVQETIMLKPYKSSEVKKYNILELLLYNFSDSIEDVRVINILPMLKYYKVDDVDKEKPLFRSTFLFDFLQYRSLLARQNVFNTSNSQEKSFDHYFYNREYKGKELTQYPISIVLAKNYISQKDTSIILSPKSALRTTAKDKIVSAKLVERIIRNDSLNKHLFLPNYSAAGYKNLANIIFDEIINNRIKYYSVSNKSDLINFEDIRERFNATEKEYLDENGKKIKILPELPIDEIKSFIFQELWLYNENNELQDIQIIKICPIVHYYEEYDYPKSHEMRRQICWVRYADLANLFSKNEVFNLNYQQCEVYQDLFLNLNYNGEISEESNITLSNAVEEINKLQLSITNQSLKKESNLPGLLLYNREITKALQCKDTATSILLFNTIEKNYSYKDLDLFRMISKIQFYLPEIKNNINLDDLNILKHSGGEVWLTQYPGLKLSNVAKFFNDFNLPIRLIFTREEQEIIMDPNNTKMLTIYLAYNDIKSLKALGIFDIKGLSLINNTGELPQTIWNFKNLSELKITNKELTIYPYEIKSLIKLKNLDLSNNMLKTLPSEIAELTDLDNLKLNGNQLTSIPAELGRNTNLIELNLSENKLLSLPAEIGNLSNLTKFYLQINQLKSLPEEIGKLKNLIYLDLSRNDSLNLASVCVAFANNKRKILITSSEYIYDSNLEKGILLIKISRLDKLPAEIERITNLTELNLSDNKLQNLPTEIGNLTNLTTLYLDKNNLKSMPAEVAKLTNLKTLYLNGNNFSEQEKQKIKQWLPKCNIKW